ncbi:MAG: Wzz/FepE/Etk N-terminal domain-containing protein [Roseitalea porphyridii]|uniref:Wzz/FepE/Etk N-terminal domain-containing protein n=1 Tax=Roseitalea porphyridii TaxID=1852022 RepID=UPI0032D8CF6A
MSRPDRRADDTETVLSLTDIFMFLWEGRRTILACALAGLVFGFAIAFVAGGSYRATIPIIAAPELEGGQVEGLNQALIFDPILVDQELSELSPIFQREVPLQLTPAVVLGMFIEELQNPAIVAQALASSGLSGEVTGRDGIGLSAAAAVIADMNFSTPDGGGTVARPWMMSLSIDGAPSELSAFVDALVEGAVASTRDVVVRRVVAAVDEREQREASAVEHLQSRARLRVALHQADLRREIAILQEQADIARRLEIEWPFSASAGEPGSGAGGDGGSQPVVVIVGSDAPGYLRGYRAIDEEMEALRSRVQSRDLVPGLPILDAAINSVRSDQSVERVLEKLEDGPFGEQGLALVVLEPGMVGIRPLIPMVAFVMFGLVLGLAVGVAAIAVRKSLGRFRMT